MSSLPTKWLCNFHSCFHFSPHWQTNIFSLETAWAVLACWINNRDASTAGTKLSHYTWSITCLPAVSNQYRLGHTSQNFHFHHKMKPTSHRKYICNLKRNYVPRQCVYDPMECTTFLRKWKAEIKSICTYCFLDLPSPRARRLILYRNRGRRLPKSWKERTQNPCQPSLKFWHSFKSQLQSQYGS